MILYYFIILLIKILLYIIPNYSLLISQTSKILASNGNEYDYFGRLVSISDNSRGCYMFEYTITINDWIQTQFISRQNNAYMSGDVAIIDTISAHAWRSLFLFQLFANVICLSIILIDCYILFINNLTDSISKVLFTTEVYMYIYLFLIIAFSLIWFVIFFSE